jgi:predicted ribosome quality control (RQC) complex YloA/Tae2 family protein
LKACQVQNEIISKKIMEKFSKEEIERIFDNLREITNTSSDRKLGVFLGKSVDYVAQCRLRCTADHVFLRSKCNELGITFEDLLSKKQSNIGGLLAIAKTGIFKNKSEVNPMPPTTQTITLTKEEFAELSELKGEVRALMRQVDQLREDNNKIIQEVGPALRACVEKRELIPVVKQSTAPR